MNIKILVNNKDECFDLVDMDSNQEHDGDGAKEIIAKVFDKEYSIVIKYLLNKYMKKS